MGQDSKRKRAQEKCSECRRQRVKCNPCDRDWDAKQQKCENCLRRGLDCGPSIRRKDDPVSNPPRDNEGPNYPASSSPTQKLTFQSPYEGSFLQDDQPGESLCFEVRRQGKRARREEEPSKDREERSLAVTSEEVKNFDSRFERLFAAGRAWVHISNGAPTHCGAPHTHGYEKPGIVTSKLKEEFHTLCIKISNSIEECDNQGDQDLASRQIMKLLLVLEIYPGLCDDQKRGAMLGMARVLKKYKDRDLYQYFLGKITGMVDPPIMPIDLDRGDPSQLLAESFLESDGEALAPFWKKHFAKDNMPSDVDIPPPLRAAQHRNPKIAEITLSKQKSTNGAPAISNLEGVHIAAAMGNLDTLSTFIDKADGRNVDARDAQGQTPLFLAAANGRQDCCSLLLQRKADPNLRDRHGHTIAEVAARSGNLHIVKMLVAQGADLHTWVARCASTPLQAAIESGYHSGELVQYLLAQHVDVSAQRVHDNETAMSLAQGKGLNDLAVQMGIIIGGQQPFYGLPCTH